MYCARIVTTIHLFECGMNWENKLAECAIINVTTGFLGIKDCM